MKKLLSIIFILILLLIIVFLANKTKEAKFKNYSFQLEIADSASEKYKGLSNRNYLCGNCAMLFLFEEKKERTFVMREMMIPIDILFIDNGIIKDIYRNLEPEGKDYNNYYKSSGAVDKVLEINANYSDKYNINVGDKIIIY
jgi:uncharacterized membrane protein (UPF0127 family)